MANDSKCALYGKCLFTNEKVRGFLLDAIVARTRDAITGLDLYGYANKFVREWIKTYCNDATFFAECPEYKSRAPEPRV